MDGVLTIEQASFGYRGGAVLRSLSLTLWRGEMVAVLGPNGSGKSTLLRGMCGVLPAQRGNVRFAGQPLAQLSARARARHIAFVPQSVVVPFAYTAWEIVLLGRAPHSGPLSRPTSEDAEIAWECMAAVDVQALARRPFASLSGGEQQRVMLAQALAQQPTLLLLDEATTHLDIGHQGAFLDLVARLAAQHGLTVMAALHDMNTAALRFPRLLLLDRGALIADGTPATVLHPATLSAVFGGTIERGPDIRPGVPLIYVPPQ